MQQVYLNSDIPFYGLCFVGCTESNDVTTQNIASSVVNESSQPESSSFEETHN